MMMMPIKMFCALYRIDTCYSQLDDTPSISCNDVVATGKDETRLMWQATLGWELGRAGLG